MPDDRNMDFTGKRTNGRRLSWEDRAAIEAGLDDGCGLGEIAAAIGAAWSTVAREVKAARTMDAGRHVPYPGPNTCRWRGGCAVTGLCGEGCAGGAGRCEDCLDPGCNGVCGRFDPMGECTRLLGAPYVCNGCPSMPGGCRWRMAFYVARLADARARELRSLPRRGISCTEEQAREMVAIVKPLLMQGQSLEHIWMTHGDSFPVGFRTFYRWIEIGLLEIINLHLPRKVRYRARRKAKPRAQRPRGALEGRTYEDFCGLPEEVQMSAVEMDCVEGRKGEAPAILTLILRRYGFQLMIRLEAQTKECVKAALDRVEELCGEELFRLLFATILTDKGGEFADPSLIEAGVGGGRRCSVYYCDTSAAQQKGRAERNHAEIRRIIPKGTPITGLTEADVALACSHVNSYRRPSLGGASPYMLASQVLPEALLDAFGVTYVPPDDVVMRPSLLRAGRQGS